jgi:ubiquinone/menaquinone biosynthesis C-methylase UbiE
MQSDDQRLETRSLPVYWLGKYCDTIENIWLFGQQASIFEDLIRLAKLRSGEVCLDLGCGTGNLCVAAKERVGNRGSVVGVDAAPKMVALTRKRAQEAGADVDVRVGVAERLSLESDVFDVVVSAFMFHHLPLDLKYEAFKEMFRVLKPGGRFLVVDEGAPNNLFAKVMTYPIRYHVQITRNLHWYEHMADNVKGALPEAATIAGFAEVHSIQKRLGWIEFLHGIKRLE